MVEHLDIIVIVIWKVNSHCFTFDHTILLCLHEGSETLRLMHNIVGGQEIKETCEILLLHQVILLEECLVLLMSFNLFRKINDLPSQFLYSGFRYSSFLISIGFQVVVSCLWGYDSDCSEQLFH